MGFLKKFSNGLFLLGLCSSFITTSILNAKTRCSYKKYEPAYEEFDSIKGNEKPVVSWIGSCANEGFLGFYTDLLNHSLKEDKVNWLRTTFDLKMTVSWGKKTVDHDAVKICAAFRHRSIWGLDSMRTDKGMLKVGDVSGFAHTHAVTKPPMWVKSLWLDFSFDSMFSDEDSSGLNRCKLGYFPFELGKGVVLGSGYGVSQDYLGEFIRNYDYSMPGILFSGTSENNMLGYNFYFARPQAKSSTTAQVLGLTKGHLIEASNIPFGGAFRDDNILAVQFDFRNEKSEVSEAAQFRLSPYGVAFFSPDNKIKLDADSSIRLYTAGLSGELNSEFIDASFDSGMNYGEQVVRSCDTNAIELSPNENAVLVQNYSQINSSADSKKAAAVEALKKELAKSLHRDGQPFTDSSNNNYVSSPTRITKSYINKYRGYMGVVDLSFKIPAAGLAISGVAGMASGDANPNKKTEDKTYKGFVGINESFENKRVPSLIVLGGGVRRPATLDSDGSPYLKDFMNGVFTDVRFVGAGFAITPSFAKEIKGKFSANALCFWKDHVGTKVVSVSEDLETNKLTAVFGADNASRNLGYELNSIISLQPINNFEISAQVAGFFPGQYYTDIKGARLGNDITKAIESFDLDQVTQNLYSIGNQPCYVFGINIKYTF